MLSLIITHPFNLFNMNEETTNQIQLLFSGFCFIIRIKKSLYTVVLQLVKEAMLVQH